MGQFLERAGRSVRAGSARRVRSSWLAKRMLKRFVWAPVHDRRERLDQPAVAVPGEPRVAGQADHPARRGVAHADVEHGLEHPRHRHRGARAHREQQRARGSRQAAGRCAFCSASRAALADVSRSRGVVAVGVGPAARQRWSSRRSPRAPAARRGPCRARPCAFAPIAISVGDLAREPSPST